ncbi:hypothetical protein Kisp02_62210 [Kineosporia sp. NBRC 101731]|nr:hypothetical protein Kisp02_62210 [Kineosporia sp. NBRC 101731]
MVRLTEPPSARTAPGDRWDAADPGAVAVEFALLLPLLMLFLFGVIQYGYGLFQLQSFGAALDGASRDASTGISDCAALDRLLTREVSENGLSPADVSDVQLEWLRDDSTVTTVPERILGQVRVTATYTPFDIGIPLIPFPSTITRSSTATVQSVLSADLTGCGS